MAVKGVVGLVAALLLVVSGCGDDGGSEVAADERGDTAVWDVDTDGPPASDDTSVRALVQRLGCANGETGEVLPPEVEEGGDEVVVTFQVEKLPLGDYSCPSNTPVPYTVELAAPLAGRNLVDGACLAGEATRTSHCVDGAQRWPVTPR